MAGGRLEATDFLTLGFFERCIVDSPSYGVVLVNTADSNPWFTTDLTSRVHRPGDGLDLLDLHYSAGL